MINIKTKAAATAETETPKKTESKKSSSFLKTGKAAMEAFHQAEQQAEAAANGLFRFFIKKDNLGVPHRIVFLDGDIGDDGMFVNPMFWEYTVYQGGKWQNFVKPNDEEGPDPIAADGNRPALVQAFTIINLTPYEKKDGTKVEAHKQLFVCKRNNMKRLAQLAKKRGGLAGCVFEVTRTNEKAENTGDTFDFEIKMSPAELAKEFGKDLAAPAQYEEVITYRSVEELKKLGFGAGQASIKAGDVNEDYSEQL